MKAYWKNVRISPKKLAIVAEVVRWQDAKWALDFLRFAPKKWANILYNIVLSAVNNAENNDAQDLENLYIDELIVSKWIVYKRGQSVSRWRMSPIRKRTSNVRLSLQVK